jgi:hypothetical protein
MELHFTPARNHYILYIKGAVLACCQAIIELLKERGAGSVVFKDVDMLAIFNDGDYVVKERIDAVFYDDKKGVVEVLGGSMKGTFDDVHWEGFNAPEVVGKIYKHLREIQDLEK